MSTAGTSWNRCDRLRPCPVCGRSKWCSFLGDYADPVAVCCTRTQSSRPIPEADGWLHVLKQAEFGSNRPKTRGRVRRYRVLDAGQIQTFQYILDEARRQLTDERVVELADLLHVSADAVRRMDIGWLPDWPGWAMGYVDSDERLVGVQIRSRTGGKIVLPGSQGRGLFVPQLGESLTLYVAEGASDAMALLSLGIPAIGRFNKSSDPHQVVRFVRRRGFRQVVVTVDRDEDGGGERQSLKLATLLRRVADVRLLRPPAKDVREWISSCDRKHNFKQYLTKD